MKISVPLFSGPRDQQIFMHSVTSLPNISSVTALVPDVDKYAERALLLAKKQDIVCVPCPVEAANTEAAAFLSANLRAVVHPFSDVFLGSTREEVQEMYDEFSLLLDEEIR